ncbi:MAG: prolipoprotein diacylglyceryl transferase family protein [Acidimicrobiales bacterium]
MKGFPTSFHLGPLVFHTYGFGLAIAAYVAYLYARRRLIGRGINVEPFGWFTVWILVAALVGARAANIATNWSYYAGHPGRWISVWQGGLASFGGIGLALVVGLILERKWWPRTSLAKFADALVPALIAGWAIGRFLGPQFMIDGGGHLTHQWFGMYYHGEVGRRVPVPIIQGLEDGTLWLVLVVLEKTRLRYATGVICSLGMIVWGLVRTTDERLLLGQESHSGSIGVQIAGLVLAAAGVATLIVHWPRRGASPSPNTRATPNEQTPLGGS